MARKQIDLCIFCDSNPCTCNTAPATKKARPKLEQSATPAPQQPQLSARAGLREIQQSREAVEFRTAFTILCRAGLISSKDIEAHRGDLLLTKPEIEVLLWKQRRNEWQYISPRHANRIRQRGT